MAPVTNRNLNKGRAGYDMNHRFVASANYELPVGKGRRYMNRGGILNTLFGGYEISWIQTVASGNPFTFTFTNSPYNYYPFTPGNAGRNIITGPGSLYSEVSAKKNFKFRERWNLQIRFDFQNPFHNYGFSAPSSQLDFKNPQLFGKITSDVATASLNGEPLMDLMLRLSW